MAGVYIASVLCWWEYFLCRSVLQSGVVTGDGIISCVCAQEGTVLYRCTDCILKKFDLCEKCFNDGEGDKHMQQCGPEHRLVKETE